jgi:hypothetical protein
MEWGPKLNDHHLFLEISKTLGGLHNFPKRECQNIALSSFLVFALSSNPPREQFRKKVKGSFVGGEKKLNMPRWFS